MLKGSLLRTRRRWRRHRRRVFRARGCRSRWLLNRLFAGYGGRGGRLVGGGRAMEEGLGAVELVVDLLAVWGLC